MDLIIEISDGELQGVRTPVRDGLTIGRSGCDLTIQDSKVSSKHAQVEQRSDGSFWLVDLGSSNKIRYDGGKAKELRLVEGVSFGLGRVSLRVLAANNFMDSTQPEIVVETPTQTWRHTINELASRARQSSAPVQREVLPFPKLIKLKILSGLQTGTEWTIGYGPRDVGHDSIDLPLFEKGLPSQCFRLIPKDQDVYLKVSDSAKGKVTINGREIDRAFLESGDEILIGDTLIEVTLE